MMPGWVGDSSRRPREELGLTYNPDMISSFAYVSQLTFYSDIDLAILNPGLKRLEDRITSAVSEIHKEQIDCRVTGLPFNMTS